jgi:hypothetical protein
LKEKKEAGRIPPMRVTAKSIFIANQVSSLTGDNKTKIIERALIDKYPLFAETYDKGIK